MVVVIGTSVGQVIINRLAHREVNPSALINVSLLFALPMISYLLATCSQAIRLAAKQRITPATANQTFLVLGVSVFSLAVPLFLLVWLRGDIRHTLAALSPAFSVASATVLSLGLSLHKRTTTRIMGPVRTAGTSLTILGGFLMLGSLVLAWPRPDILVAVGIVNTAMLIVLAIVGRLPILHAAAVSSAAIAYVIGFHWLQGNFESLADVTGRQLVSIILMGRTAAALIPGAAIVAGVGAAWWKARRPREAESYWLSAGIVTLVAVFIAAYAGFWSGIDAELATPVLLLAAGGVLIGGNLRHDAKLSWLGSGLLLITWIHGFGFNDWLSSRLPQWQFVADRPIVFAVLCHGLFIQLLALSVFALKRRFGTTSANADRAEIAGWLEPLASSGAVTAAVVIPFIFMPWNWDLDVRASHFGLVALSWFIASLTLKSRQLTIASEAVASVAIAFATAAIAQRQEWLPEPLTDLRHFQLQVIVLGVWCMILSAVATWMGSRRHETIGAYAISLDRLLLLLLAGVAFVVSAVGCWPGVQVELGYRLAAETTSHVAWHSQAYQAGGWLALGVVVAALIVTQIRGRWVPGLAGLVISGATTAMLISGSFETQHAVVSALRWSFAACAVLLSSVWCGRSQISQALRGIGLASSDTDLPTQRMIRDVTALCSYLPVIVLTSWVVGRVAVGAALGGPLADTFFGRLSHAVSYATPLGIVVVAMLMVAIRDRLSGMALAASATFVYVIALSVLLPVLSAGEPLTVGVTASLLACCASGLGGFTLLWLALSRWIETPNSTSGSHWLRTQLTATAAVTLLVPVWSVAEFFVSPSANEDIHWALGSWPSYLAALLALSAFAWHLRRDLHMVAAHVVVPFILAVCVVVCSTVQGNIPQPAWLGYHCLTISLLSVGLLLAATACWATWVDRLKHCVTQLAIWATCISTAALVLIVRGCVDDPLGPWWTVGTCGAVAATLALLGLRARSQWYAYATWAIGIFTVTFYWVHFGQARFLQAVTDLLMLNLAIAALVGLVWLAVEVWYQLQRNESMDRQFRLPPVHLTIAVVGSITLLFVVAAAATLSTVTRFAGSNPPFSISDPLHFFTLGSVVALLIGTLWDRRATAALATLYLWGLAGIAMVLNLVERQGQWGPQGTVIGACLLGAAYIAVTGHLWKWGLNLAQVAIRLGMPQPIARLERTSRWLPTVNIIGSVAICLLGFVTVLTAELRWMRMSAAFAPLLLAYGIACLAQERRRATLQCLALIVASVAGVYIGWADMVPSSAGTDWLVRVVRLLLVLCGTTFLYGVVVARWVGLSHKWSDSVRRTALILGVSALATLLAVLSMEVTLFQPGTGTPLDTPLVVAVSVMLAALAVALLSMAIAPGRDPLELSERGRQGYVYLAQIVVALLFGHLYLTRPMLFDSFLRPYWPYLVMLLAFAGVAAAEFFERRGWRVISEPLQRSGGLLPLVPVLGMWIVGSDSVYSLLLFFVGLLYLFMCITRRSLVSGVLAAVAANAALWAFWNESDWAFGDQPQLWMIPPALSVLLAAQINRKRLSFNQLTAIRYACATIIYLSSTGEMFMRMMTPEGHADMLRPMILASLSVAGIMAGIMLRIRAFLYLGASFLFLSIITMVWHAARIVQHTWPWWAFGIGLGLMILVMFGIFEKKRSELTELVERMRQWEQ